MGNLIHNKYRISHGIKAVHAFSVNVHAVLKQAVQTLEHAMQTIEHAVQTLKHVVQALEDAVQTLEPAVPMHAVHGVRRAATALCVFMCTAAAFTGCTSKPDKYALRDSGIEQYQNGDYAGAIESFNAALEASDGQVSELQLDILKYRGECEIRTGNYKAAKTTCEALKEVCRDEDDIAQAKRVYDELGALDTISKAVDLMADGSYSRAYELLDKHAELDGTLTGRAAVYNKAVCAENMGNFEEAYTLFTAYLAMYPDDEAAQKEAAFCRTR